MNVAQQGNDERQLVKTIEIAMHQSVNAHDLVEEGLRKSEALYRSLVESVQEYAIYKLDLLGNVRSWNTGAERLKGYTADEIIGRHFSCFYSEEDIQSEKPDRILKMAADHGQVNEESWRVRKDGSRFWASVTITALCGTDGQLDGFVKVTRDLTDRNRAEQELIHANRALQTLSRCNQSRVHATDEKSLLHSICRNIVETGEYRMAWVGYAKQDEAMTVLPVAQAGYEEGYLETLKLTWADTPRGCGPTGTAIRIGKAVIASDILTDPNFGPWREEALKRGYASSIALPLIVEGQTIGALNIYARDTDAFDPKERNLLTELAGDLSYGIAALRTRAKQGKVEQAVRELEVRFHSTLDSMLEGCQIIGFDWRYLYVNDAATMQGKVTKEELLGRTMMEMYPGIENTELFAILRCCMEERSIHRLENEFAFPDGSKGWFELSIQPVPEGISILSEDITERKQAEGLLIQSKTHAEALINIATRLNDQLDLDQVLEVICEETARALDVPVVSVYLSDEQNESLSPAWTIGLPPGAAERLPILSHARFQQLSNKTDGLIIIPDVKAVPGLPGADRMAELDIRSHVSISLQYKKQLIGCLNINAMGETRHFTQDEFALLRGLADQAVQALANALLFAQAKTRLNRMLALRRIDIAIISTLDLQISIDIILGQVIELMDVDAACVLLFHSPLQTLKYYAGRGFRTNALQYTDLRIGKGYAGRAALEQRIIHISDLRAPQTDFLRSPTFAVEGFVAYYAIPLIAKGQLKGVLEIFHRTALEYVKESLDFLEALAGQTAIAIDNSSLFLDLQRSNQNLIQAYDATIEGWSHALDLRDRETEGHTHRVTVLTLDLAQAMGVNESELIHIRRGALLHDIGKLGVPDSILHKPGLLTEEEWDLMRKHPVFAYEMLASIDYLRPALDIPHYHHEKWDGTGYPQGLKGMQIPFAARLFAVVDVWDALTEYRPYRNVWTREKTLEYIREQAGKHFDPRVVNAFSELSQKW